MPIWWVGLVGIVCLAVGAIWNIDGLLAAGAISLVGAVLGLLVALFKRR